MQEPRPSKLASYAVARQSGSEIPQQDLNTPFQLYASSAKTRCFIPRKGGEEHEGKMYFMRRGTQPRSRDFRRLFGPGQMLFMQRYDGGEVRPWGDIFNKPSGRVREQVELSQSYRKATIEEHPDLMAAYGFREGEVCG
jgi:hypothetical protein